MKISKSQVTHVVGRRGWHFPHKTLYKVLMWNCSVEIFSKPDAIPHNTYVIPLLMLKGRILFAVIVFIAVMAANGAVLEARAQTTCAVVDKSRAALFITFDKSSGSDAWLRLHNNSTCAITVETSNDAPRRAGAGKPIAVHYLIHERRKSTTRPASDWGDTVGTAELEGNDSFTFIVPLSQLRKDSGVAVPFVYAWETDYVGAGFVGGLQHLVFFLSADLPPGLARHH